MIFLNQMFLSIVLIVTLTSGILSAYLLSKPAPYKTLGLILTISFLWSGLSFLLLSKIFSISPLILLNFQGLSLSAISILWLDFSLSYSVLKKRWYNLGLNFSYIILAFIAISLVVYNFDHKITNQLDNIVKTAWFFSSFLQLSLLASSIYLLKKASLYVPNQNKYQFKTLILSVALPFLAILVYLIQSFSSHSNNSHYSLTLVFFFSNVSLFTSLFRNKLIESLPNTYQSLFYSNNNYIILIDKQANIINHNSKANIFLQELSTSPIGKNIYELIPNLPSKEEHFKDIAVNIFSYNLDELDIYADINFYPVRSLGFGINAYILEIKDVSSHIIDFKQIEQLSKFQQVLISLASQTTEQSISDSFYQVVLEHAAKIIPNADMGSVLLKSNNGKFQYIAAVGFSLADVKDIHYSEEQIFFGEFITNKDLIVKSHDEGLEKSHVDQEHFKILKKALPIIVDIKATLTIPIFLEGNLAAILSLDSFQSCQAFDIEAKNLSKIFSQKITDFIQKSHIQRKLIKEANLKFLFSKCEHKIINYKLGLSSFPRIANIILKAKDLSVDKVSLLELTDESSVSCISYSIDNDELKKSILEVKKETKANILELIANKGSKYIDDFNNNSQLGQSLYLVPLGEINKVKTMVVVSANSPYAFDFEERAFLENSYNCVNRLFEKQRVQSKLKQLSTFRKAIVQISNEFLGDSPESNFYNKLLVKAIDIIPEIDKGSVLLLKEDNRYHFETAVGFDLAILQKISFSIEEFPFDYNLPKNSFIVKDLAETTIPNLDKKQLSILQNFGDIRKIKATIYVPIKISGSLQGFFCLDSISTYQIETSSQEMAQVLGSQSANILQRTQILRQTQQQAQSYEKLFKSSEIQRRKLAILNNIIKYTAQETNIDNLLQKTVNTISKTLNNRHIAIAMFDKDLVQMFYPKGYKINPRIKENIIKGIGNISETAKTGKEVFLADVSKSKNYIDNGEIGIVSEIAVAIKIDGDIIGVLNIEHIKELDKSYLELAQSLAEQLSISIARAKLFKKVNESELRLKLLAENSKDIISLHDLDGTRLYLSPSIEEVLGFSINELLGKAFGDRTHPDDVKLVYKHWQQLIQERNKKPEEQLTIKKALVYRKQHKSGHYIWLESLGNYVYNEDREMTGYVASTRDISKRIALEESLKHQALYDELTGLANRRLFLDRVEQALKRNSRKAKKFAILFFDLDRFKLVNDSYGHQVGDKLLIEIAQRLKMVLRENDTATRLGGDEFCVLIESLRSEKEAVEITIRIQTAINQAFIYDGRDININASFGLAFKQKHYNNAAELLRNADIAMYETKQKRPENQLTIFNQTMHKKIVKRLQVDSDLRKAIEFDEFRLEYQPIFNISTKEVIGFESLLRWFHKASNSLISPETFIPIAEKNGYISDIDIWVLNKSCKQLVKWRNKYYFNNLSISVNLTAKTFEMDNFVGILEEIIKRTGIKKHELKLELTERTIMKNPNKGIEILDKLQSQGIEIHIDDFGTGYSSLNYLHKLQLSALKIDRSFINLIGKAEDQALVETIITLAKLRNLKIIAEGIETKEQLETLKLLGCEYGQGWLFSKSLEPKQIEKQYLAKTLTTT